MRTLFLVLTLSLFARADASSVEIIAHRGASADAPENTLPAVHLAWKQNADAVEIDIHLSKDGRIVVIHDDNTRKVAGKDANVRDQTFAELSQLDVGLWKGAPWEGTRIPSLDEVIEAVPPGKCLVIEIKCGPEVIPPLAALLRKSRLSRDQIIIIGFSYFTLSAAKTAMPDYRTYWLSSFKLNEKTKTWSPAAPELIRKASAAGFEGLNLNHKGPVDAAFVKQVKESGLEILVWTVNDTALARRLVDDGVQGITTDCPAALRDSLD